MFPAVFSWGMGKLTSLEIGQSKENVSEKVYVLRVLRDFWHFETIDNFIIIWRYGAGNLNISGAFSFYRIVITYRKISPLFAPKLVKVGQGELVRIFGPIGQNQAE